MTEAELNQILQRLERLEAEVRQLAEAVRQVLSAKAESEPTDDAMALHEPIAPYPVAPQEKNILPTAHPHIVKIPGVQGGEPIVRGVTRTVRGIVELSQRGLTPQQILEGWEGRLTLAQVYDALSYYYDNQEEIDQLIAEHKAALEEGRRWMQAREAESAHPPKP